MNIFYFSKNPRECAEQHCDKHVVKMIVEYAQLLSTAHHVLDGETAICGIYKKTHMNHPCARWARESDGNYLWLYALLSNLLDVYSQRYNREHATAKLLPCLRHLPKNIPKDFFHPPPICMPDECKVFGDPIQSYQNYYNLHKAHFARWGNDRAAPGWFTDERIYRKS